VALQTLGSRIFQMMRGNVHFQAQRLNAVLYPLGSDLRMHTDNLEGEVLVFSVGCTVLFEVQVKDDPSFVLSMESGDVLNFIFVFVLPLLSSDCHGCLFIGNELTDSILRLVTQKLDTTSTVGSSTQEPYTVFTKSIAFECNDTCLNNLRIVLKGR
jgi:hypothetical protein